MSIKKCLKAKLTMKRTLLIIFGEENTGSDGTNEGRTLAPCDDGLSCELGGIPRRWVVPQREYWHENL